MEAVKTKRTKVKYELPTFLMERLMDKIAELVKHAPHGIVVLIIDLFCGAGGSSDGLMKALARNGVKCFMTIVGINHDLKAIYSHAKNHQYAYYSTEDFKSAKLDIVMMIIEECKKRFPQCPVIIWASFDCTNHSNAKGGMSRDADSRTLAWHIFRYLKVIKPMGLWVENVKEFSEWGPLMFKTVMIKGKKKQTAPEIIPDDQLQTYYTDLMNAGYHCYSCLEYIKDEVKKKKKIGVTAITVPVKSQKGIYYKEWVKDVRKHGKFDHVPMFLNCADFGVPQNRKRLFIVFMQKGIFIAKPKQTHAKVPFGDLKPHVPVKECINFDNEGESIFTPGKITSDESYKRIYKGLIKFVAGGKKEFMAQRNSGEAGSRVFSTDQPARSVTTTGGNQEVVQAQFLTQSNGGDPAHKVSGMDDPARTVTAADNKQIVKAHFITRYNGNKGDQITSPNSIEEPSSTLTTENRFYPTTVKFLTRANGTTEGKHNPGSSMEEASPTVTTLPTLGVANVSFITKRYSANNNTSQNPGSSMDEPAPTITTIGNGIGVAKVNFLDVVYGNGTPSSMDNVSPTVRTKDGLQRVTTEFITNYQGMSSANSLDEPAPTLMTQEKLALTGVRYFICNSYTGGGQVDSTDNASSTLTTNPKQRLVAAKPWISPTNFDNAGTSIDQPSPTILASRKHHNIIYTRQWGGNMSGMDVVAPTVIARQDKEPMSMITLDEMQAEEADVFMAIPVFEGDSETVILIKEFMALYGIADIMIRMLEVMELLKIQSFSPDYYLAPGTTDQKKYIGNAVPPLMAQRIAEAMYDSIVDYIVVALKLAA